MRKGIFISFEGLDGTGKTTQIRYLKKFLDEKNITYIVSREPGGTKLGEKLRKLVLDVRNENLDDNAEVLIYAAARAQHVGEIIKPALESGKVVICDRYVDSSLAYQGYGRKMLNEVFSINDIITKDVMPDITFLLQMKPQNSLERIAIRENDRMEKESMSFHERVYRGYEELAKKYPHRIVKIDASKSKKEIALEIGIKVEKMLIERGI